MDDSPRVVEPMTPNLLVENTSLTSSQSLKRKALEAEIEDVNSEWKLKKANAAKERKQKAAENSPRTVVELKGRKLVYRPEPLPKSLLVNKKYVHQMMGLIIKAEEEQKPIESIPEDLWSLIVFHGHECLARTEGLLVKQLRSALIMDTGTEYLPNTAIARHIPTLFEQVDFGFLPTDFPPSQHGTKIPVSLQLRAWEAKDIDKYCTSEELVMYKVRQDSRKKVREECLRMLEGLDDVEKLELLKGDKAEKGEKPDKGGKAEGSVTKEEEKAVSLREALADVPSDEVRKSREGTANTVGSSRRSSSPSKRPSKLTDEELEERRLKKEANEAKKAEKAEKKAAEEREAERKAAVKAKQQQSFGSFFKPNPKPVEPISRATPAGPSTLAPVEVKVAVSDFLKTFKGIEDRPNVVWADINKFRRVRRRSEGDEGIPAEEVVAWGECGAPGVNGWSNDDFLREHLSKHRMTKRKPRRNLPSGLKTAAPWGTVGDVLAAMQEADDPRKLSEQLKNPRKFPWKTLAFDQQVRPPYYGTYTKKSATVGARTPFAQDPTIDYSYDSGDDWQDDEGGEDVDDFGEAKAGDDEEEEDNDEEEEDDEFADWLDDTEEGGYEPGTLDGNENFQVLEASMAQSRLPMKVVKKATKEVVKKVVKVVPSWKGPCWERTIGAGHEGLEGFKLQLLNDTPCGIDPFTYTSLDPVQTYLPSYTTTAIGYNLSVKTLVSTSCTTSKVKAPLETPLPSGSFSNASAPTQGLAVAPTLKTRPMPKAAFPETHLAELFKLIDGNTKIRTDLVSQLKAHFEGVTTKAAIEAKIREVAVREGKKVDSQWKIKPEAWTALGSYPAHDEPMIIDP